MVMSGKPCCFWKDSLGTVTARSRYFERKGATTSELKNSLFIISVVGLWYHDFSHPLSPSPLDPSTALPCSQRHRNRVLADQKERMDRQHRINEPSLQRAKRACAWRLEASARSLVVAARAGKEGKVAAAMEAARRSEREQQTAKVCLGST